ncbi:MAG: YggT family protein [Acidimicrobiia bacterium]
MSVSFIASIAVNVLFIMQICIFVYFLLSFFPLAPGSMFSQIRDFLGRYIEPVLLKIRRYMPRMGMFDLSGLVLLIAIMIAQSILRSFI